MITFKRLVLLLPLLLVPLLLVPASASAAPAAPGFSLESIAAPTHFTTTSEFNTYRVSAQNIGSVATNGTPIELTDTLPKGITVQSLELYLQGEHQEVGEPPTERGEKDCTGGKVIKCSYPQPLAPDETLLLVADVSVDEAEVPPGSALQNEVSVSGGGAATVASGAANEVNPVPAAFGLSGFDFYKDGLNGTQENQAGAHPYQVTTTIALNNVLKTVPGIEGGGRVENPASLEDLRDIVVDLPLGFAGSTLAAPYCTEAEMGSAAHCPPDTIVGWLTAEPDTLPTGINSPIWNIQPEYGHPAEFGYVDVLKGAHIAGYVSVVPTPAGYVLRFVADQIPEIDLSRIVATFYGDPVKRDAEAQGVEPPSGQVPFFTNPTACSNGPQEAKIWIDSWTHPAQFQPGSAGLVPANLSEPAWKEYTSLAPPVTGCDSLQFNPEIGSQPTTHEADAPSGLEFEQRLPQTENMGVAATPALKNTVISFPPGMTVDPSSADGLGTCSDAQIGWEGHAPAQPGELYDFTENKPECPESSKIGVLELETPLIPGILHGEVFLAAQNANPFGSTFATYIVVNDPVTGVVLKLAGELKLNEATGQMTAVFEETPQLPFSHLKVHFFGGPRAELATPPNCGIYRTSSELTPWSALLNAGDGATPFDDFTIDEDCAIGFDPGFAALTANLQAGAYTPFEGSFEREDSDQELQGLTMNLPPGMLANVASVTECGQSEIQAEEADAPSGGCPASSQVGTVVAEAGPGPNPLAVPGKIFWTGPYNGGAFGLAVVVSANPGPFHFGNVVVRQSLRIDPLTAAATDVSDPFPTFIHPVGANGQVNGVPIKLRRVDFAINRPGFTFNPASCDKFAVSAAIASTGGLLANREAPFQITNCGDLKYEPKLTVTSNAHTSKANGASLNFRIAYPKTAAVGNQAWFKSAKFTIPEQLPARLTTIQKACLSKVFESNPAACPVESRIGYATVHTQILPTTLAGPLYFVSYGNAKFPEAVLVLQGDGVEIVLHGETFISHTGVTSATFKSLPDAPFENIEVNVPSGPYSEFAANGNLCAEASKLKMPIVFTASDGAEIKEETPIGVSGCAPAIHVVGHKVKGKTATLTVSVPSAGKLTAGGKGLSKAAKQAKGAGTVTVKLHLATGEAAFLSKHKGRKLRAKVNLTFVPKKGGKLKTSTNVLIG